MSKKKGIDTALNIEKAAILLKAGTEKLQLTLDENQRQKLFSYLQFLLKWNKVYNLTAVRNAEEAVKLHFLDSLAAAIVTKPYQRLLDVGSGAGFPGMVMAVLYPERSVSVIDTVGKKTAFLSQLRAELDVKNVQVHTGRVEAFMPETKFDAVISRAFADLSTFTALSKHLLAENGSFYAMKGLLPQKEIAALDAGWQVKAVSLTVPFLNAARHMIIIRRS